MGKFYQIAVKPHYRKPDKFMLFNEASGAICGDRLYKGDEPKHSKGRWPFKAGSEWVTHDTQKSAEAAAKKLQTYLDFIEGKRK